MSEVLYNHFILGPLTRDESEYATCELPNLISTVVVEYFGFKYNGSGMFKGAKA